MLSPRARRAWFHKDAKAHSDGCSVTDQSVSEAFVHCPLFQKCIRAVKWDNSNYVQLLIMPPDIGAISDCTGPVGHMIAHLLGSEGKADCRIFVKGRVDLCGGGGIPGGLVSCGAENGRRKHFLKPLLDIRPMLCILFNVLSIKHQGELGGMSSC